MADNAQRSRPPPNRRRDKIQVSCDACRHRKLRCDRHRPCGACSKRGLANSCNFHPDASPSAVDAQSSVALRQPTSLHGRITELESLVVTLMNGQSLPNQPAPDSARPSLHDAPPAPVVPHIQTAKTVSDEAASAADPGTLNVHESRPSYVQSVHWEAILAKVRGLKEDFVADSKVPPGSHLFYGPNRHVPREEILAAVPSRPVVDRLLALQFETYSVTPCIIHGKKFLREYEAFWDDPSATSIAWIGLMYSMLFVAAQLHTFLSINFANERSDSLEAECLSMRETFRDKTVQCLLLARYTTGGPHILETLIMILTGEAVLMTNSATDGWLSISLVLHIAMRMGYHRDPDHFPGISPFEGEMRRRVWAMILQSDLGISLETGLPRNATDTHMDTRLPRNLHDYDFDVDMTEIPVSRPETEWTPILPLITRGRLRSVLGLICDINSDIRPSSHAEVARIDALLEDVHSSAIPPVLRWESTPNPITDSPTLVVQRVSVETTYYKSRILLHRRALINHPIGQPRGRRDQESIRICLESALKILSFQQMLHEESQPFGRLCRLRWKVTHIFLQDVLLATSVLCLYLQDVDKYEWPQAAEQSTASWTRVEEIRQQLIISHRIWVQMSATSVEAGKVARALSVVLRNSDAPTEDYATRASDHLLTDFDAITPNEFGSTFNNQYLPSGFYPPLAFFDNVLETWSS